MQHARSNSASRRTEPDRRRHNSSDGRQRQDRDRDREEPSRHGGYGEDRGRSHDRHRDSREGRPPAPPQPLSSRYRDELTNHDRQPSHSRSPLPRDAAALAQARSTPPKPSSGAGLRAAGSNPFISELLKQSQAKLRAAAAASEAPAATNGQDSDGDGNGGAGSQPGSGTASGRSGGGGAAAFGSGRSDGSVSENTGSDAEAGELVGSPAGEGKGSASKQRRKRKHSPITWRPTDGSSRHGFESAEDGKGGNGGSKSQKLSALDRAAREVAAFRAQQLALEDGGFDPDGPPIMKASPSHSGSSEDGKSVRDSAQNRQTEPDEDEDMDELAEAKPPTGARSRWTQAEEEADSQPQHDQKLDAKQRRIGSGKGGREGSPSLSSDSSDAGRRGEATGEPLDSDEEGAARMAQLQGTPPIAPTLAAVAECRLVDEYERLNRIEEGTYGVVFRAREKKTGKICALKKIKMERESNGFPVTSIREINILLNLHHPNIVNVSEVVMGRGQDDIYMVMEFVDHDLKKMMDKSTRSFSVAEVKCLMQQLLAGVAYLHRNWVLHRDLKTSNILYNNSGELKICDLGLARQYGSPLRAYTQPVVTLWYRAPELLLGVKKYSTAVDMWSCGAIMGELLTGDALFKGQSEFAQINEVITLLGTPTEEIWPGLKSTPHYGKVLFKQAPSQLRAKFKSTFGSSAALTEAGLDLLQSLLHYDPLQRITAEAALQHRWFFESPLPQSKTLMPQFKAFQEGGPTLRHAAAG